MTILRRVLGLGLSLALILAAPLAGAASSAPVPEEAYAALRWRLLGPFRAGWSLCATGAPGQPDTFYFGAADGGVWKTTDAGNTWAPLFEGESAASVSALVVAPSDPNVLYAGTGQVELRYDNMSGTGVYRSADGGKTWERAGLEDARHIGRVLVDPRDPRVVLVAALGHLFGPNPERGVFRSEDGGRSWAKVLYKDADTGAGDLASDPARPEIVYAALWQARRYPWMDYFIPAVGPGSGIYRSTDGGKTWNQLASGLPPGPLGRIGLAVAPGSQGRRVYATIAAGKGAGLYRSDDAGATWQRVNDDESLAERYFARVTVDPRDLDTVYVMGRSLRRSTDGGKTFTIVKGSPGGDDYHFMWIDPGHPARMILASDQGTTITVNDGNSWSSWYNQPTGQFYHVATDRRFPYWIYSSQQDSGTVGIASRSDYGQLSFRDWHPVGGDERDYALPDPQNPEIVYSSGLGGRISRWDARTGRVENVSAWPVNTYAKRPTTVRYRYDWLTPLAISPLPPHALYLGAQVLFRSTDGGRHWETISPDLTGAEPGAQGCDGDVSAARARACGFGVIYTIAPSPVERDLIWVGTDSGLVQLTPDAGKTWLNVTPPGLSEWSKIAQIDASPTDPATAYAAVDRHRLDDFRPHVYRTHDYGRTWTEVSEGLPQDSYVNVVRQDPAEPRLLFAGTRTSAFVSFDEGARWSPLRLNLPTTGVNDMTVRGNDLVIATQGRALWALDDVSPLRQLGRVSLDAPAVFHPPATAYRLRRNENRDTPLPPDEPLAMNPPAGAVIDYFLRSKPAGPVTLEIRDGRGEVVRRWSSDETPARPKADRYFAERWLKPPAPLPSEPGPHRFVWDLREERPRAIEYEYSIAAVQWDDTPALPQGALVLPGRYEAHLTVDGETLTQPLVVEMDPRVRVSPADLEAQRALQQDVGRVLGQAASAFDDVESLEKRLKEAAARLTGGGRAREARAAAELLLTDIARFRTGDSDDNIAAISGVLAPLATDLEASDGPPTEPQRQVLEDYGKRLDAALSGWQALRKDRLPKLDALLRKAGLGPLS